LLITNDRELNDRLPIMHETQNHCASTGVWNPKR
jgi:hypothetical protein